MSQGETGLPRKGGQNCLFMPEYLTTTQLAERLSMPEGSLEQLRRRGGGPPFIRITPKLVRYNWADVETWFSERVNRPAPRGAKRAVQS